MIVFLEAIVFLEVIAFLEAIVFFEVIAFLEAIVFFEVIAFLEAIVFFEVIAFLEAISSAEEAYRDAVVVRYSANPEIGCPFCLCGRTLTNLCKIEENLSTRFIELFN